MSYGNGYAIFGQPPVFCSASSDLAAHLSQQDRDEKRGEHVDSLIDDAIDDMLDGPALNDLVIALIDQAASRKTLPPVSELLENDGAAIGNFDDWMRVLLRVSGEQRAFVLHNFQQWAYRVFQRNADDLGITEHAENLADAEEAQAREDRELFRAGIDG